MASQSVGLIGRTVEVSTPGGPVEGTVTTLNFHKGTRWSPCGPPTARSRVGPTLDQMTLVR